MILPFCIKFSFIISISLKLIDYSISYSLNQIIKQLLYFFTIVSLAYMKHFVFMRRQLHTDFVSILPNYNHAKIQRGDNKLKNKKYTRIDKRRMVCNNRKLCPPPPLYLFRKIKRRTFPLTLLLIIGWIMISKW